MPVMVAIVGHSASLFMCSLNEFTVRQTLGVRVAEALALRDVARACAAIACCTRPPGSCRSPAPRAKSQSPSSSPFTMQWQLGERSRRPSVLLGVLVVVSVLMVVIWQT